MSGPLTKNNGKAQLARPTTVLYMVYCMGTSELLQCDSVLIEVWLPLLNVPIHGLDTHDWRLVVLVGGPIGPKSA